MTTINISGGFHNAGVITVQAKADPRGGIKLSTGQARRINRHMCGVKGCICGMHHGWRVNGTTVGDLAEAMTDAEYANVTNSYRNAK